MRPGALVRTTALGPGRIVRRTSRGALVELLNYDNLVVHMSEFDITPDPTAAEPPESPVPAARSKAEDKVQALSSRRSEPLADGPREVRVVRSVMPRESDQGVSDRLSVEALRFGLVPSGRIREMTVNGEGLERWVADKLPHSNGDGPTISEVWGPFGAGKSHAMALVRHLAASEGYLTAHVEVDGSRITLSEPEPLLYQLWATLRGHDWESPTPLLDVACEALDRGADPPSLGTASGDRVAKNYRALRAMRELKLVDGNAETVDALFCSSSQVAPPDLLRSIRTNDPFVSLAGLEFEKVIPWSPVFARPSAFVEALVAYAILIRRAGYRGLVVTIDEFEIEHLMTRVKVQRVAVLIEKLAAYLAGESPYPRAPLAIFIAAIGKEGAKGDDLLDTLMTEAGGESLSLRPWTDEHRQALAARIHHLYVQAYGVHDAFDPKFAEEIGSEAGDVADSGFVRAFIKRYVAGLDSKYAAATS